MCTLLVSGHFVLDSTTYLSQQYFAIILHPELLSNGPRNGNLTHRSCLGGMLRRERDDTCNWCFCAASSLGTMKSIPDELLLVEAGAVSCNISPSATPGHQDWLRITAGESFGSCTHVVSGFASPNFRGKAGIGVFL